ncbi:MULTISPECIES: phospholipase [Pseudomonas]|uniref:Phospholipase n=1 Tax=Pseudomonas aphyarum TaxID=2942629 RepID=A0ABT5PVF1_9PSED|nr:phospholipase [Pseudomonas aphyarum]MDD0969679.1 phospholipase [Pseudomonas aphyarum]MDD1127759.1 phospholipase [Pseudomonas aphyarum]
MKLISLLLLCAMAPTAWGWSNHTVGSYLALQDLPALRDASPVEVEPLEQFLSEQYPAIVALLDEQERFAREHFKQYPPRPDNLKLPATPSDNLRHDFLTALRINPQIYLAMVIQPLPGKDLPEREHLQADQVMVEQTLSPWNRQRFIRVADHEKVAPLAVLASAADEPDYGHDINLFSDNPGEVAALYGFGPQPFGDARFQYSSQAPFHMGFFHESPVVYAAAGFLERSWPDWRAYQYMGLARLAFASGHSYWGYRFLGWGLHHVQDLTQPYHAKPLPGVELPSLLLLEGKALAGFAEDKQASIERVATRHMEVEKYQSTWLRRVLRAGQPHPMLDAYADAAGDAHYPPYSVDYLREVVSAESVDDSAAFDEAIGQWLETAPVTSDFSAGNQLQRETFEHPQLNQQLLRLLGHFGAHSRIYVRAGLAP